MDSNTDAKSGPEAVASPGSSTPRSRRPPAWGIVVFLLLLAGLAVLNQWMTTGGEGITWIDDDLDAALEQARARDVRVFLYLYEPGEPTHQRNERVVFTQRWAREPLKHAVSCRIALRPDDVRRARYDYKHEPVFLVLNARGEPTSRADGAVDERAFFTYVGKPVTDYVKQRDVLRNQPAPGP